MGGKEDLCRLASGSSAFPKGCLSAGAILADTLKTVSGFCTGLAFFGMLLAFGDTRTGPCWMTAGSVVLLPVLEGAEGNEEEADDGLAFGGGCFCPGEGALAFDESLGCGGSGGAGAGAFEG